MQGARFRLARGDVLREPRRVLRSIASIVVGCAACSGGALPDPEPPPPEEREHHARFIGLWAVEQPTHAAYEVTYYQLAADGTLVTGVSDPADCLGHLSEHCVTGSVARCLPEAPSDRCSAELTCVFGDEWWSRGADTLVIRGDCSDAIPRDITIQLAADASANTEWGGAGGTLVSVGGEAAWSHDNWPWAFRKCPPGTDPTRCVP